FSQLEFQLVLRGSGPALRIAVHEDRTELRHQPLGLDRHGLARDGGSRQQAERDTGQQMAHGHLPQPASNTASACSSASGAPQITTMSPSWNWVSPGGSRPRTPSRRMPVKATAAPACRASSTTLPMHHEPGGTTTVRTCSSKGTSPVEESPRAITLRSIS